MKFHEFTKYVTTSKTEPVLVDLENISTVTKERGDDRVHFLKDMEGKARLHFKAAAEGGMKSVLLDQSYDEIKKFLTAPQP